MLSSFFPSSPAVQYVIAFAIIFVLLALFALVLRRLTGGRLSLPGQDKGRARQPRLGIVDVYDLDRQRQLILLRRDNVEHLLLIGGPNDVVVETNIVRVAGARIPGQAEAAERIEARGEPGFERTVDPPRPAVEPTVTARIGPAPALAEASDADEELAPIGQTAPQPTPAQMQPVLKPDVLTRAPARPAPPAAPPPRPVAAPRGNRPEETRPQPPARPEVPPVRPPVGAPPAREPSASDAGVLSDMAKHLEQALQRPHAAVRPSSAAGVPPRPEEAAPPARPMPPQPQPPGARPMPAARPPEPPPVMEAPRPGAPATAVTDPFSVEEIEAEFARLLGRPLDREGER